MKTSTFKLFLCCILLTSAACSSNDSSEDEIMVPKQNSYDYYVDSAMQKSIEQLGITIHKGSTPPNVEGVYTIDPFYCSKSNFGDLAQGTTFGASTLTLSNQKTADLSIDFKNFLSYSNEVKYETWEGTGSFISGEGNKFSILLHSNGAIDYGIYISKYQNLIILSGELDLKDGKIKGIKNLQLASIMSDDYGDQYNRLISIGEGRLFTNKYADVK